VAQAIWCERPDAAALASIGLTEADYEDDNVIEVWPDNVTAINVFIGMDTQWFWTEGCRVGLRYEALPEVWRRNRIPPNEREEVFQDLRVLERAALKQMGEDAKRRNANG